MTRLLKLYEKHRKLLQLLPLLGVVSASFGFEFWGVVLSFKDVNIIICILILYLSIRSIKRALQDMIKRRAERAVWDKILNNKTP